MASLVDRGEVWLWKEAYDQAIADYDEAIRLDPGHAKAYLDRGRAWQRNGKIDQALADYSEAVRLDPEDASAHHTRAWLWATCPDANYRDGKQAVASAIRACELSHRSGRVRSTSTREGFAMRHLVKVLECMALLSLGVAHAPALMVPFRVRRITRDSEALFHH